MRLEDLHIGEKEAMTRNSVVLVLAWTLLLLPVLCTGGWLLHPCDCGSTIGCEHESSCNSDPCEIDVARPDLDSEFDAAAGSFNVYTSAASIHLSDAFSSDLSTCRPNAINASAYHGRAFPPSDLPLLI